MVWGSDFVSFVASCETWIEGWMGAAGAATGRLQ
jgi:hypothetical protein